MYSRFLAFMPRSFWLFLKKSNIREKMEKKLEVREDLSEAEVFHDAEPGPFSESEVDHEGEKDDPRIAEDEDGEHVPAYERVADERDKEGFQSQEKSGFATLLDLGRDEFLGERDHDEKREDGNRSEAGTMEVSARDEDPEDGEGHDGNRDSNTRQVQEAELLQDKTRDHAHQDDADENGDAVFEAVRIEGEKSEGDDRRRIDAERLDAHHLAEEGDERRDDGNHQEERDGLKRHALRNDKTDPRMVVHMRKR